MKMNPKKYLSDSDLLNFFVYIHLLFKQDISVPAINVLQCKSFNVKSSECRKVDFASLHL